MQASAFYGNAFFEDVDRNLPPLTKTSMAIIHIPIISEFCYCLVFVREIAWQKPNRVTRMDLCFCGSGDELQRDVEEAAVNFYSDGCAEYGEYEMN